MVLKCRELSGGEICIFSLAWIQVFMFCFREEITQAVRRAAQKVQAKEIRVQDIDEQMIGRNI